MDGRNKRNQRPESSLLLHPGSLVTWDMSGNSVFMPVAVQSSNSSKMSATGNLNATDEGATQTGEPLFSSGACNERHSTESMSVTQLKQPLIVCKSSSSSQPPAASMSEPNMMMPQTFSQPFIQYSTEGHMDDQLQNPANDSFGFTSSLSSFYRNPYSIPHQSSSGLTPKHTSDALRYPADISDAFAYQATVPHWFFKKIIEQRELWHGFSPEDSYNIEKTYHKALQENVFDDVVISVEGGRYDIYLPQREKRSVYWEETPLHVRRCTWFYKVENAQKYIPYDENISLLLEELYYKCATTNKWQQKLLLDGGEVIMMEGPHTILHFSHGLDAWTTVTDAKSNPKAVIRGIPEESVILSNETNKIDHLVFVVQGIGSFCDLSFRTVYQCVDGFREIANNLIPIHFKSELEAGMIGRIEFLPLGWHGSLHTDVGFDRQMKGITLPSIPKLRYFTNDTLLDILLYSSPMYCQAIIDTVTSGLNRLYSLFLFRNPNFRGHVSVAGHSLGSLILFDILANQPSISDNTKSGNDEFCDILHTTPSSSRRSSIQIPSESKQEQPKITIETVFEELNLQEYIQIFLEEKVDFESLILCKEEELKMLGLPMGPRKKLLEFIKKCDTKTSIGDDKKKNKKSGGCSHTNITK